MNLKELENYFNSVELPDYIELEGGLIKIETKKTVESHINFLKGNPKNKLYQPYYDRLLKIYLQVKK